MKTFPALICFCVSLMAALIMLPAVAMAQKYDIAINNGRVIDPETGLDAIRHVGISKGTITEISETPLDGVRVIEANGLIVSPGFIDIHSHSFELTGQRMQAFDGVTTALEMESGALPIDQWYKLQADEGRVINYGASASWSFARIAAMVPEMPAVEPTAEWYQKAFRYKNWTTDVTTDEQQQQIIDALQKGLDQGAIGIGVNSGYVPGSGGKELTAVWSLAAANNVPVSTHIREWSNTDPLSSVEGVSTIIGITAATGARTNVCHINSSSLRDSKMTVSALKRARADGIDIHAEAYPYGLASFPIGSSIYLFDREKFMRRIGIDFDAVRLIAQGRQIKNEDDIRAEQAKDPGQFTIMKFLDETKSEDEEILSVSMSEPWIAIASDAVPWNLPDGSNLRGNVWPLPEKALSNPRSAGTFSRFLGRWVREKGILDWSEAIAKVSLIPARLFDGMVPAIERKGRLQIGKDADITIFDPMTIMDRATIDQPGLTSNGVNYLIVNGTVLIDGGKMDLNARPGRPVRRPSSN